MLDLMPISHVLRTVTHITWNALNNAAAGEDEAAPAAEAAAPAEEPAAGPHAGRAGLGLLDRRGLSWI